MTTNNMTVNFDVTVISDVNIIGKNKPVVLLSGEHYTVIRWVDGDNSYKGDVLKLKAVDFPYAIFDRLTGGLMMFHESRRITMDLRTVELKQLSKEYVNAATSKT